MNKRVASDILKKYNDTNTRDEAIKIAEDQGYILRVQIEAGNEKLVSVSDEGTTLDAADLDLEDDPTSVEEPVEQVAAKGSKAPQK